jgi:hypothetical protein
MMKAKSFYLKEINTGGYSRVASIFHVENMSKAEKAIYKVQSDD